MLKLLPYHKHGHICIDDNIVSVANYFDKKHIYMYAKGLNFTYSPRIQKGESVLHTIRTCSTYPISGQNLLTELDYMQDFVGLYLNRIPSTNLSKHELVDYIIISIEEEAPIGIFIDTYYTPWLDKYYQKVHMPHSFLIIDINKKEKYVLCIDGFSSDRFVKLPFENLFSYTGIMTFKPTIPRMNASFRNVISQIVNGLRDNNKLDNCDCIRFFSHDVEGIVFSDEEKTIYQELHNSQFIFGLKTIEYSRKNIADMFCYMCNDFPDQSDNLFSIKSKIDMITEQWKLLIVYFVKGFYSGQTSHYMNKAAELLLLIANYEEDVARSLTALI